MIAVRVLNDTSHVDVYDRKRIMGVWWRNTEVLVTIILPITLASIQFNYLQTSNKMLCHGDPSNLGLGLLRNKCPC